jgi:transposase
VTASSKYIPERGVIDGQQRLTTLQVLIDAARSVLETNEMTQAAAILDGLVTNEEKYRSVADDQFKVWPTNLDRPIYRAVMGSSSPIDYKDFDESEARIASAHRYFHKEIHGWADEIGDTDKRCRRLDSLATALRELLLVVEITLDESDNAQVIFETLNDRGTPLQASDLVKNLLFQEIEATGQASEPLYAAHWEPFDTTPWRRKVAQGRLYRPRVDLFLQHWLVLRTLRDVSSTDIFSQFRTYARDKEEDATALLIDLARTGAAWDAFDHQDPHGALGTFVYRQRIMQADSLGPVMLWLHDPADPVPAEQAEIGLAALESWLVRRMVCRMTTKDYNSLYVELLNQLGQSDAATRGSAVQEFLLGQTAESRVWPTDEAVRAAFVELPLYRLLTRGRLRMVLEALEDELRGTKTEEPVVRGRLTIEHVLPQGWREHWLLPGPDDAHEVEAEARNLMVHTIGNLTLLTRSLNSGISNGPWIDKRKGIEDYGVLRLSAPLKVAEQWDEASIAQRSADLAAVACRVWPRP